MIDCYPPLASMLYSLLARIQQQLDVLAPGLYRADLNETWRSVDEQLEYLRHGTSKAQPEEAPHCVTKRDGARCAMAADFWILERETGRLAPDGALIWAAIPTAAHLVARDQLASGAFFRSVPGGDWPHIEWKDWRSITTRVASGAPRILVE